MQAYRYTRVPPRHATGRHVSNEQLLACWRDGLDTYAIALQLNIPEYEVYNRLRRIRATARLTQEWDFDAMAPVGGANA